MALDASGHVPVAGWQSVAAQASAASWGRPVPAVRSGLKVSPSALAARLRQLGLVTADYRNRLRGVTTEVCHLLAQHADLHEKRVAAARARRLPLGPARGLYEGYLAGDTTLRPLAAYLDMDVEELRDALEPEPPAATAPTADAEKGDLIFQP